MKKLKLASLFFLLLILTSCREYKYKVDMPTASSGGSLYPLGASIARILNIDENFKATVQVSQGGIDNLNLVYDGDANISFGVSSIVSMSYEGKSVFKNRENKKLRVIASLYLNPNQIVVLKNSKINSIKDLKDAIFSEGAVGSTTAIEYENHLKSMMGSIPKALNISPAESLEQMKVGKLDGVWIMAGAPSSTITEMLLTTDSKVLSIPEDEIKKITENYPWYEEYTIDKKIYKTESDIKTTATRMLIYTSEDENKNLVYNFTRIFWENIDELKRENKVLKDVKIEDAMRGIGKIPMHSGALKYYEEVLHDKK